MFEEGLKTVQKTEDGEADRRDEDENGENNRRRNRFPRRNRRFRGNRRRGDGENANVSENDGERGENPTPDVSAETAGNDSENANGQKKPRRRYNRRRKPTAPDNAAE